MNDTLTLSRDARRLERSLRLSPDLDAPIALADLYEEHGQATEAARWRLYGAWLPAVRQVIEEGEEAYPPDHDRDRPALHKRSIYRLPASSRLRVQSLSPGPFWAGGSPPLTIDLGLAWCPRRVDISVALHIDGGAYTDTTAIWSGWLIRKKLDLPGRYIYLRDRFLFLAGEYLDRRAKGPAVRALAPCCPLCGGSLMPGRSYYRTVTLDCAACGLTWYSRQAD